MEYDYIECGDCLELMKGIPDKSIDLIVTDPPYVELDPRYYDIACKRLDEVETP